MSLHDLIQSAKSIDLFPDFATLPWYQRCLFTMRVKAAVVLCEVKYRLFRRL